MEDGKPRIQVPIQYPVDIKTVGRNKLAITDSAHMTFDGFDMGVRSIQTLRNLLVGEESPGLLKNVEPGFRKGGNESQGDLVPENP